MTAGDGGGALAGNLFRGMIDDYCTGIERLLLLVELLLTLGILIVKYEY